MYHFTIPMALMDFIPGIFFGITMVVLLRDLYGKMGPGAYAMFAAGTIQVFAAGMLKALWKLLYAANICDFHVLNSMFLPVQSLGFLLIGLGLVGMFCRKRQAAALAVAPPVFSGSFVFIMMMVLGLGCLCASLSVLAGKMKKKGAIALFVLGFVCYMGMGYMSGQDSTSAAVNWIEQGINCVGQGLLVWGVLILHKAGLKDFEI